MIRFASLLALAALIASLFAVQWPARVSAQDDGDYIGGQSAVPLGIGPTQTLPTGLLGQSLRPLEQNQVRIRQRVVVRISPAPTRARAQLLADTPRRALREVEHDDCVEVGSIVGVQPTSDNRLLFFTDQRQVLAATLEQSCVARAFYAGFYVERSDDGKLCVTRDLLQSRAGASCEVARFNRVVTAGD